jgi:hypothetical protein
MTQREPQLPEEEPDFAEEHSRPTYENEHVDEPAVPGDESVPKGPWGDDQEEPKGPL